MTTTTALAPALAQALRDYPLTNLDQTVNGELAPVAMQQLEHHLRHLGYHLVVPVILRRASRLSLHRTE